MANHTDGESRLRRFAQAFRREANPRPDLATSLMAGLGERRRQSRLAMLPAIAMAAFVLVAGLGLAFGAMELRSLGHPSPTPPVSLITPTPSPSPSPTATPSPLATPSGAIPESVPALASIHTPAGQALVAVDSVGAGTGEEVFYVKGREASFPFLPAEVPADATIIGIVDHWSLA